ncbi:MAG TPA: transcriptional regulator [Polyangiaceae bacterium]|nr:transcriptional regulator [Polyangiaceae bacterium]
MTRHKPNDVPERHETGRQALRAVLGPTPASIKELSALAGLREKEVLDHLEHLERSLKAEGKKLVVLPPRCLACGFVFRDRDRLKKPSRCPECKSERIEAARFGI